MRNESPHVLTRRQREILSHVEGGGKVHCDYRGGRADDMRNWAFTQWVAAPGLTTGCDKSARTLIAAKLAEIHEPKPRYGHFLRLST